MKADEDSDDDATDASADATGSTTLASAPAPDHHDLTSPMVVPASAPNRDGGSRADAQDDRHTVSSREEDEVKKMKSTRGWGLPWLFAAFSMLMLRPGLLFADEGTTMALALNAGESYVINNVSPGETPAVNVITNPHALVVHNEEPGKVVLLGAEAGEWTVAVKTTDGSTVKYDVTVKSVGTAFDINHAAQGPGTNRGHRCDYGYRGSGSGEDGSGHRSGCPRRRFARRRLSEATRPRRIQWRPRRPARRRSGSALEFQLLRRRSVTRALILLLRFRLLPTRHLRRRRVRRLRRRCRTSDFGSIRLSV